MKKPPQLFNHLDQAARADHRYACTIYSSVINLYYNTGIKLEQSDIDFLVTDAVNKKILNPKFGGGLEANMMNVYSYVKKKHPELKYKIFNNADAQFEQYLKEGYMVRIGIRVNKAYTYDSQDNGILDAIDYNKLKGNQETGDILEHATDMLTWTKESSDLDKTFIFDSYFGRKKFNLYEINPKEIKDVLMYNCYIFYVD